MTDYEIDMLGDYAALIGVTRAAVCTLIVQRELNVRQLKSRSTSFNSVKRSGGYRRVTVHVRDEAVKLAFTRHVQSVGIGSDEAVGQLFRQELKDRWLAANFALPGNHS